MNKENTVCAVFVRIGIGDSRVISFSALYCNLTN